MSESFLSKEEQKELLDLAKEAIKRRLADEQLPEPAIESQKLLNPGAAFVTIKIDGNLRGCIGYTEAFEPLAQNIVRCAMAAAFEDPRFTPLIKSEFDDITVEISVLTPMKQVANPEEVEAGRHGLMISAQGRRGLLLPQVAVEHGWGRETFLEQTCHKAGLPSDCWQAADTKIFVFEAVIFSEKDFL